MKSPFKVLCRFLPGMIIGLISSQAVSTPLASLVETQQSFVRAEKQEVGCEYPQLLTKSISEDEINAHFQPDQDAKACQETDLQFKQLKAQANDLENKGKTAARFPVYTEIWKALAKTKRAQLASLQAETPVFAPTERTSLAGISVDPWTVEMSLRNSLHVSSLAHDSSKVPISQCHLTTSESDIANATDHRYQQSFWHERLLHDGYDCTVKLYQKVAKHLNASVSQRPAQEDFSGHLQSWTPQAKNSLKEKLQGQAVILVPQLGFDIPSSPFSPPTEKLDFDYLQTSFQAIGARFYVVQRTSLASVIEEVRESTANLDKILAQEAILQKTKTPKIYFMARSMGGLVLRLMIEQQPKLRAQTKGIVLIGSTPFGSSVAEFKSRMDAYDQEYVQIANPLTETAETVAGFFNPSLRAVVEDGGQRRNVESMAFSHYTPKQDLGIDIPVLNVLLIPPRVTDYFNGSTRVAGVDLTFLQMAMYGPTEGSSPLASASWDTQRSLRLIDGRLNHLSFWEWEKPKAMELWFSAWLTGFESGLFDP